MGDADKPQGDLSAEFRALGENLMAIFHAAWESPQRETLQQEVEAGLANVAATLNKASAQFAQSPAGQRLRAEFKDVQERVHSGDVEAKARAELLSALRKINAELSNFAGRASASQSGDSAAKEPPDSSGAPAG